MVNGEGDDALRRRFGDREFAGLMAEVSKAARDAIAVQSVLPLWLVHFGPQVVAYFRQWSTSEAIADLSSQVSPEEFEGAFGASHEELSSLVEAKTVTINRLMVRGHATRQPALPDFFVG